MGNASDPVTTYVALFQADLAPTHRLSSDWLSDMTLRDCTSLCVTLCDLWLYRTLQNSIELYRTLYDTLTTQRSLSTFAQTKL